MFNRIRFSDQNVGAKRSVHILLIKSICTFDQFARIGSNFIVQIRELIAIRTHFTFLVRKKGKKWLNFND